MTGLTGTPQHNRLSGIKRYSKDDFDKWFADYDVSDSLLTEPEYFLQILPSSLTWLDPGGNTGLHRYFSH